MNMKRMRGRNHRPNGGGGGSGSGGFSRNQQNGIPLNRNHVFDSSGPEMRVRGTAQQLHEKYTQMARDASSSGDRVTGEAYYQHAEHYFRIISAINQAQGQNGQAPNPQHQGQPYQSPQYQAPQTSYNNGQPEHRRPPQQNGNGGNGFGQEPQEPAESRSYEPRQAAPRQDYQDRRVERPREAPEQRFDRIDISSALEAELAATVMPAVQNQQPAPRIVEAATPAPQAIPIQTMPPAPAAPAVAASADPAAPALPRRRGRPPRVIRPDAGGTEKV